MPDRPLILPAEEMRAHALRTLAELVGGVFAERMRIEAAARIIVTARRVALLAEAGLLDPVPTGGGGAVEALAARWDSVAMTVTEFVETLPPAELAAVLEEAPLWAEAVWAGQERLAAAEKALLLQRA
ncbi:MAG: hypothetical protein MUF65_12720 [Rubritepida sp.]|nr:hypothetical protein [Rubritepida sp.]MCU0946217.1 hypothetical protein [Rubritepida sp.]